MIEWCQSSRYRLQTCILWLSHISGGALEKEYSTLRSQRSHKSTKAKVVACYCEGRSGARAERGRAISGFRISNAAGFRKANSKSVGMAAQYQSLFGGAHESHQVGKIANKYQTRSNQPVANKQYRNSNCLFSEASYQAQTAIQFVASKNCNPNAKPCLPYRKLY